VPESLAGQFRTTATIMLFAQWGLFYCRTVYVKPNSDLYDCVLRLRLSSSCNFVVNVNVTLKVACLVRQSHVVTVMSISSASLSFMIQISPRLWYARRSRPGEFYRKCVNRSVDKTIIVKSRELELTQYSSTTEGTMLRAVFLILNVVSLIFLLHVCSFTRRSARSICHWRSW